jgi:hypothetical protein
MTSGLDTPAFLDAHALQFRIPRSKNTKEATMQRLISSRLGAGAGAAGAVVYVASAFTAGSPLRPDASVSKIVAHLSDKRGALLAGVLLAVLGVGMLLWFLSYLRAFLAQLEGGRAPLAGVTMASWVTLLVIVVAGATPLAAVIWRGARGVNPQIASFAFDVSNLSLYSLSAPAAALSVLAPMVVIWRSGALSRWLVVLGAIEIVVNVAELAGLFVRTGSDAAGYVWGVGPFVWVVWVAAVSVTMLVKAG